MITTVDQEALFKLISKYLKQDVVCFAIGGTAMMFYGYKNATKDIDLVFHSQDDQKLFIAAIKELGYREQAVKVAYNEKRIAHPGKPVLYSRGDERFDLFAGNVFGFELAQDLPITQRHDFPEFLTVKILSKEFLVLLKSITGREKDFEDIVAIVKVEKTLNWDFIIDEAIRQKKHNSWILIDLEETLLKLKEITFIPAKHFEKIYSSQNK